jgi:hypothetical protein
MSEKARAIPAGLALTVLTAFGLSRSAATRLSDIRLQSFAGKQESNYEKHPEGNYNDIENRNINCRRTSADAIECGLTSDYAIWAEQSVLCGQYLALAGAAF